MDALTQPPVKARCGIGCTTCRIQSAAATGYKALKWDDVRQGKIAQDSTYFLREGEAEPFDPAAGWVNGDTLPRRTLRTPEGSMADIEVQDKGRCHDGLWPELSAWQAAQPVL